MKETKMDRFPRIAFLCETNVKKPCLAWHKTIKPYVVLIDLQSAIPRLP
jgi:hypothetical protein